MPAARASPAAASKDGNGGKDEDKDKAAAAARAKLEYERPLPIASMYDESELVDNSNGTAVPGAAGTQVLCS